MTIIYTLLWFLVVPVIVGWLGGYLLIKKVPPAWFARFMQRRFARAFGVPYQLTDRERDLARQLAGASADAYRKLADEYADTVRHTEGPNVIVTNVKTPDAAKPAAAIARHQSLNDAYNRHGALGQTAAQAVQDFSQVVPETAAPLPSIGFKAPSNAVLSMLPRQVTGTLRKSAGSVVHKIEDAPAPIRFLAGMLVEGTEYRLIKRDGAIHLMAMGEATPLSGIAQESRTAPQITDKTDIVPDMGDEDHGSFAGAHAAFQRTLDELEVGQGHQLVTLSDESSSWDVCERCNKHGDELAEPCTPVNE